MNIPDKAIEAAARAIYESKTGRDGYSTSNHRGAWLNIARHAMGAAAPFIAAQALRDFASQVVHDDPDDDRWRWETSDVADAARAYARELDPS